jgi:SAM-dependent methyltransferase
MSSFYTEDYYKAIKEGSRKSAREIVPLVLELTQPKSVVDIGCGSGDWLSVFEEFGIEDYLGIDGDYIDENMLEIPKNKFLPFDLKNPLLIDRKFDLVVSLEVAEHLPIECAETFVDSLTHLGPVILFSAALPFQGGTNHLNEQWPGYWAKYFLNRGYLAIDCLRKKLWQNDNVEWWYIQNIFLYIRKDCLESYPLLEREYENAAPYPLSMVHPKLYSIKIKELQELEAELEKQVAELQEWGSGLEKQVVELQEWGSGLEKQVAELQILKPGCISLKNVLRALPALTKHAFHRKINRFF